MTPAAWLLVAVAAASIILAALASAAAAAIEALPKGRTPSSDADGGPRAGTLAAILARRDFALRSLTVAATVAIASGTLAAAALLAAVVAGDPAKTVLAILAGVATVAAVIAVPRLVAIRDPEWTAFTLAGIAAAFTAVLLPFTGPVEAIARGLLAIAGRRPAPEPAAPTGHEELRGAVDLLHREGAVVKSDRDMVGGVLDLAKLTVADVMVHRTRMRALDADEPPADLVRQILDSPYTRIPLWRGQPDDIIGLVHAKDVLRALQRLKGDASALDIDDVASDPWFVPDTTRLDDQLKAFLKRKIHLALVVDEYGEVQGLVTLEDIIEEIVGEIADEQDIVAQGVRPQPDGSVNVSGAVPIRDLNRVMDWSLPDDEAITVAGLVIHEARIIPDAGQTFTFHGFRFRVLRRQRNRVTALRITPLRILAERAGG
jgi:Mg2+/Co2+ transporter CorB